MSTQAKSRAAALILAAAGVLIVQYVPADAQAAFATVVATLVGWLGLKQPGTKA